MTRAERREQGICNRCSNLTIDGKAGCEECLAKAREYNRKKYAANPEPRLAKNRQYRRNNPEKVRNFKSRYRNLDAEGKRKILEKQRDTVLQNTYGITRIEYNQMFQEQNEVCAICEKPETSVDYRSGKVLDLAVDHHHTMGQVRALLCRRCNQTLGQIDEDPIILDRMISYLANHSIKEMETHGKTSQAA